MDLSAMQLLSLQGANWQRSGGQGEKPSMFPRPVEERDEQKPATSGTEGYDVGEIRDEMALRRRRLQAARLAQKRAAEQEPDKAAAPRVRLKARQVSDIKRRLARGDTRKAVAAAFGVSAATISNIATGKTWGHVQ